MATARKNLSVYQPESVPDGTDVTVGIVASEWNEDICNDLLNGAVDTLTKHGVKEENIHIARVPGAFELPYGASILLKSETLDGVLCLGCVIKGETRHDEYINSAVASGITQLGLVSGKPVTYGVITAEDEEQAIDRSGGKHGNKGVEGAVTLLRMITLKKDLGKRKGKHIGF
jgi:6,7-dimethyl-8-ribityllumazine synthase